MDESKTTPATEAREQTELLALTANEANATTESAYDGWRRSLLEIGEILVSALLVVGLLFCCFFRTAGVDGESMEDTLLNGDHLLIYHFFYTPKRGDIVIINRYQADDAYVELPLVKRVIAVAGDTVRVTADAVYVNGEKLEEDYIHYPNNPTSASWVIRDEDGNVLEEATVPEGKIFVMGDHRDYSKDSRMLGFMNEEDVMGKAVLRLFPLQKFGGLYD